MVFHVTNCELGTTIVSLVLMEIVFAAKQPTERTTGTSQVQRIHRTQAVYIQPLETGAAASGSTDERHTTRDGRIFSIGQSEEFVSRQSHYPRRDRKTIANASRCRHCPAPNQPPTQSRINLSQGP